MGIVRTTAYPSRYAEETWEEEPQAYEEPVGKFYLRFDALSRNMRPNAFPNKTRRQREIAALVGKATGNKPEFRRRERFYRIGEWTVSNGTTVVSELFDIEEAERVLRVLDAFLDAGLKPDEEVVICFKPEQYDKKLVLNLANVMEARSKLIVQALGLSGEIQIIIGHDLAFGVPLNAFSFEVVEACVYLMRQAAIQAMSVGKARMLACDMENPKYQMRTWLLRLGFIGDAYSRPRQTLLKNLEGNGAFFDDSGKERAALKRKARRMAI